MRSFFLRIFSSAAVIALMFFSVSGAKAQDCGGRGKPGNVTNAGTEFLVCFMQNETPDYDPQEVQQIYLAALSDPALVTITCRNFPLLNQQFALPAYKSAIFQVNHNPLISWPSTGIINSDEVLDSTVFVVTASAPISCYGLNIKQFTADAFISLPNNVAANDYMVLSYYNSTQITGSEEPSEFCVAAFKDKTIIEVNCTAQTLTGISAGVPTRYTLDSGMAIQFQAARLD